MEGDELPVVRYVIQQDASMPLSGENRVNEGDRGRGAHYTQSPVVLLYCLVDVLRVVACRLKAGVTDEEVLKRYAVPRVGRVERALPTIEARPHKPLVVRTTALREQPLDGVWIGV